MGRLYDAGVLTGSYTAECPSAVLVAELAVLANNTGAIGHDGVIKASDIQFLPSSNYVAKSAEISVN
jgi:hypothetical protein